MNIYIHINFCIKLAGKNIDKICSREEKQISFKIRFLLRFFSKNSIFPVLAYFRSETKAHLAEMEWRSCFSCIFLLLSLSLLAGVSASASASLSDGIFVNQASTGRNLLQAKKPCPISFEFQNYTVITSQCRGPQYPAKQCCEALVQFGCPFSDFLNDLSNDCASTMFSYINLHGKYPPGLFASECTGDKNGLPCPELAPSQSANSNNSQMSCRLSPMLMMMMIATLLMGLLLLLL